MVFFFWFKLMFSFCALQTRSSRPSTCANCASCLTWLSLARHWATNTRTTSWRPVCQRWPRIWLPEGNLLALFFPFFPLLWNSFKIFLLFICICFYSRVGDEKINKGLFLLLNRNKFVYTMNEYSQIENKDTKTEKDKKERKAELFRHKFETRK